MFKRFLKNLKKPFIKTMKIAAITSLGVVAVSLIVGMISVLLGKLSLLGIAPMIFKTYVISFLIQVLIVLPWLFVYSGARALFENIFPNKKDVIDNKGNVVEDKVSQVKQNYPITKISKRKIEIQEMIMEFLRNNKEKLDIEEIHILERINNELLEKTNDTYHSLDKDKQEKHEEDVLKRFDELEKIALDTVNKVKRIKEHELERQLNIIDEMKKDD